MTKRKNLADEEEQEAPIYYVENGLRKVQPYWYQYRTFSKERWFGKSLLTVLCTEFRDRDREYYVKAIEEGRIRLFHPNQPSETLTIDQSGERVIRNGQVLTHRVHRHEPPVSSQSSQIIYRDEEILVVDKPGSIPVHPSGRYHFNSLLNILKDENEDLKNVTLYSEFGRLDRLTSGVVIFALKQKKAQELENLLRSSKVRKKYLAKVKGEFPPSELVVCKAKIKTVSHKLGLNLVDEVNGKDCETEFQRLYFDGTCSLVQCFPKTGRTHQIRVHLAYLGHPIVDDPLYARDDIGNAACSVSHDGEEDIVKNLLANDTKEGKCDECEQDLLPDPAQQSICLHAESYKLYFEDGRCLEFHTPQLPSWAGQVVSSDSLSS